MLSLGEDDRSAPGRIVYTLLSFDASDKHASPELRLLRQPHGNRTLAIVRGSITVQLSSCLTGLDLTKQIKIVVHST